MGVGEWEGTTYRDVGGVRLGLGDADGQGVAGGLVGTVEALRRGVHHLGRVPDRQDARRIRPFRLALPDEGQPLEGREGHLQATHVTRTRLR